MDLVTAIDLASIDYRLAEDPTATARQVVDAIVNGRMVDHHQVARWLADGTIGPDTAAAYRAVLDATLTDLDTALRRPAVARFVTGT